MHGHAVQVIGGEVGPKVRGRPNTKPHSPQDKAENVGLLPANGAVLILDAP